MIEVKNPTHTSLFVTKMRGKPISITVGESDLEIRMELNDFVSVAMTEMELNDFLSATMIEMSSPVFMLSKASLEKKLSAAFEKAKASLEKNLRGAFDKVIYQMKKETVRG